MTALTSKMKLGVDRMAIVLNGEALNVATVQAVLGERFVIEGLSKPGEISNLVDSLNHPLETPLRVELYEATSTEK